ncbi:ATP-dependent RNA helicase DDX25-like [Sitophilus oryzae]|uniref:ATP-dependent RNA helicase DDX25-like n=1 Tax=Sitophilus oryzae TaxID=7048 RepID=A0A6J2Y251_SITOR|nr:ATP-dependent RNA helicase DDX25-like [Sitophilus oryzae]
MSQKINWANYLAQTETKLSNVSVNDIGQPDEDAPEKFSPAEASLLAKIIRKGLVETKSDIEVQRKDPKSPLYSVKTFEALNSKTNISIQRIGLLSRT